MSTESQKTQEEARPEGQHTGISVGGNLYAPGSQIAGHNLYTQSGPQAAKDLNNLFAPLFTQIEQRLPENREEANEKANALKAEAAQGEKANDERMGKLIDELVQLVPGAVQTIVAMFGQPILAGLAGPVTKFVLGKLSGKK